MGLLDIIFPKKCLECGFQGKYLCNKCLKKVPKVKSSCPVCIRPSVDGFTHVGCVSPHSLDGVIYLTSYKGVVRKAIITMKYKFVYDIANEISTLAVQRIRENIVLPDKLLIIPIPVHKRRKKWRGFNQMVLIGQKVAKQKKWFFKEDLLIRNQYKHPQTMLKRTDRLSNTLGVFSFNKKYLGMDRNLQVVIFDDVWTTGATLREAGKVLKRNGFSNVWGLTIAR